MRFTVFCGSTGTGRIHLFRGNGAVVSASTPDESLLFGNPATLNKYDMTMIACQETPAEQTTDDKQRLIDHANRGGRVFATHYAYAWLYNQTPFSSTANWAPNQTPPSPDPQNAFVNQSFAKGLQLAQWLKAIGASTTLGQVPLANLRLDQVGVLGATQPWLTINDPVSGPEVMQFTFNTPVGLRRTCSADGCCSTSTTSNRPTTAAEWSSRPSAPRER